MFNLFRRCDHKWKDMDTYYHHELTQYINSSDGVLMYKVKKCSLCGDETTELIDEAYYPVNNKDSYDEKRKHLQLLKRNKIKSKEEYIVQRSKGLGLA